MDQAVLVHLDGATLGAFLGAGLDEIEDPLMAAIADADLGEFDGNEIAVDGSGATLYMYGPDAERLFTGIEQVLRSSRLCKNARVEIRAGGPGAAARLVMI